MDMNNDKNQEIGLFTVYHSRGSAQRKAHPRTDGDAKKDPGSPKIRLLQMETTQQILKPRLRTEASPNRVDLEIEEIRFGPPIAIF